ncbi:hypothetical protein AB0K14_40475 [Actinosynnema sp. NPDC050801]|uniref:hypothetical protein n=1 Tax=unclassified Actinosynnema TaxID=2637065 RepID=UPI0033D0C742
MRRYGFHGLSHTRAARRAVRLAGGGSRVVTCRLGAGCSLAAVHDGRSVDTTMGFTPLAGLPMATRSGDLDPGPMLWLSDRLGVDELADGLSHRSGLVGLSGHGDLRDVHAAIASGRRSTTALTRVNKPSPRAMGAVECRQKPPSAVGRGWRLPIRSRSGAPTTFTPSSAQYSATANQRDSHQSL